MREIVYSIQAKNHGKRYHGPLYVSESMMGHLILKPLHSDLRKDFETPEEACEFLNNRARDKWTDAILRVCAVNGPVVRILKTAAVQKSEIIEAATAVVRYYNEAEETDPDAWHEMIMRLEKALSKRDEEKAF